MKKFLLSLLSITCVCGAMAQSAKHVQWSYTAKKISDKIYEVHLTANIDDGYHLYAQDKTGKALAATTFTFNKNPLTNYEGDVKENGKMIKKFEAALNQDMMYYEKTVDFVQVVKLKGNAKTNLSGKVEFIVCNRDYCLPASEVAINVNVGG